ncbi:Argonaute siRNA chaperone complex subunit Arb1-domain-containing protein [Lipomyces arxii]|uniref:Argonaute siRNA chaperone complex subunit Arb1-domain-containing protein n=1 Tax=Lipomyces arxii TaxID=56418 RepID=UPI0034CE574F
MTSIASVANSFEPEKELPEPTTLNQAAAREKKEKKKSRNSKKKSATQKALERGSGFEMYYADNPITAAQWDEEQDKYDPSLHSLRERLDYCLMAYKQKRYLNPHRARIFQIYLAFGKISKFRYAAQQNDSTTEPEESADKFVYDEVIDAEDWRMRAQRFFGHHLPCNLRFLKDSDTLEAIDVVDNLVRYMLYHNVCPEFQCALFETIKYAKMARYELPMINKLANLLPGPFNSAVSQVLGGQYGYLNPSLPQQLIYDDWVEPTAADLLSGNNVDSEPFVVVPPKSLDISVDKLLESADLLFEAKAELGQTEVENVYDDDNDLPIVSTIVEERAQNAELEELVSDVVTAGENVDSAEQDEKCAELAYLHSRTHEWQRTLSQNNAETQLEWAKDIEFEKQLEYDAEEPWVPVPATGKYDYVTTVEDAELVAAKVLFNDVSEKSVAKLKNLSYLEEYVMPVEVVKISEATSFLKDDLLCKIIVRPWWNMFEDELARPDDCPFMEDHLLTLLIEKDLADLMYPLMKLNAKFKRLSDGTVVFDEVTAIGCSFYIHSTTTGN